jgi:hypothetical protein
MSRSKRPRSEPRGHLGVQFRAADWLYMDRDEFASGRPTFREGIAYVGIPWASDWFDPTGQLLRFPYVGSFTSQFSNVFFACDGAEVGAVEAWGTLSEMEGAPPLTSTGEVDAKRLAAFQGYLVVRKRAQALLDAARE